MSSSTTESTEARDALVQRMFTSAIGTLEMLHVYIGDRLGLYRALADRGRLDAAGLAAATGIDRRYAREWLEQQAVAGLIEVAGGSGAESREYSLPAGHAEVLLDPDSPYFQAATSRVMVGIASVMPQVLQAFRTGGGVPYEDFGPDVREGIAGGNRPMFVHLLGTEWLPAIPDVDARLRSRPPAHVADFGCGVGNSTVAMALAYPLAEVVGIDLDAASIATAKQNATTAGVADRVAFEQRDAADPSLSGQFDLVTAFETIHDMADPVGALRAIRGLLREGGSVVIGDEKVAEEFTAPGDELERYMYGFSAVHCLAAAMGDPNSAMTGTVMRPGTLKRYATEAGFARVEILPIENDVWRFYRLYP
jgi:2-polyprenyl-3-methyl-5-hydroxy-6-metoxy-1,4-benzoquinol methylase